MAMLIAWQTINAVRSLAVNASLAFSRRHAGPHDQKIAFAFSSRTTPTATTLTANCPSDMLGDVNKAKIVITNYHAFKLRERIELSAGGRSCLRAG